MITKLPIEKYQSVKNLFSIEDPNVAFSEGVIYQNIRGEIWVDSVDQPNSALVMNGGEYSMIAGRLAGEIHNSYLSILKEKKNTSLIIAGSNFDEKYLQDKKTIGRLAFRLNKLSDLKIDIIPEEIRKHSKIEFINANNINNCAWGKRMMSFLGSEINLKLNKAICMVYDDKIIAEAYSIAGKHCIEIGTIVHENYRQMGLASFICSELIKRVIKNNNVEIFWTCDKSNTASIKTAKKIGFTMVQEYLCYAC